MKHGYRLPTGGRIERDTHLQFTFDGRHLFGFAGDTLASALLANGVSLIGRSFKYHRPRGFLCAGVEEPNGLFTLGEGARLEPNILGTTAELFDGLTARSQNCWPSPRTDLMAINSLLAPLLSAGFYYKTFMGPTRGSWMFYERFIRRAAGLGRGVHQRDPDRYETRQAFADVLVIGAGPAGLSAAVTAARSGARVVIAEQDSLLGGSLLRESMTGPVEEWRERMQSELASLANVEVLRRTTAFGLYDGNTAALLERREHPGADPSKGSARQIVTTLRARAIVFACGAMERSLVFANNDRPGVMLASAVRTYLNRFAVACGKVAVVATNNDSAYDAAFDLARCGVAVTVADQRPSISPSLLAKGKALGATLLPATEVAGISGQKHVKAVLLHGSGDRARPTQLQCDLVAMSGGWSPTVHLTSHAGIKPRYRPEIAAFVPGGYGEGQFGAGAITGSFTLAAAIDEGIDSGRSAAAYAGREAAGAVLARPALEGGENDTTCIWSMPGRDGKAFVDFQNDVTVQDLVLAHQEGYQSVEHLKRYTTLGMGTDQGKTSNVHALGIMAHLRGVEIPAAGITTFRPPFTPVAMGALAGRVIGKRFRPTRRSPLHETHQALGAKMIEAGPWLRAWFYPWAGETAESAYIREMQLVRRAVGISDISTLGKIDVQGPDAAEFLNRVYVNGFAKLPIGKARYGVMLTDDGVVLDDGTTTRLSATRYFMTTTTAQAAEVMSWLEFLLQTAWPELKVQVTSVTDEWAGVVVAGPQARAALALAFPALDLSDAALAPMGCAEFEVDGTLLRFIRLSFSGELSYEIYVPADFAASLWDHLLTMAEPLGIKPYGLEALASLRIEKGHVAGLELDHRNTLDDLGLAKMARPEKPFIGRELRQRRELQSPTRWSLIGIECLEPSKRLRGGSILFSSSDRIEGHGRGYITSVTWSTELEKFIALGLYQGGIKHVGEEIICAYPLKGEQVRARIVAPVFIDAEGDRLRV